MDIQKKEVLVNMPVACYSISVVVDSDAIVNDSKPDLLRIVQIDPAVKITKTEVMDGKMMIAGHVSYKILYQPENADGVCSMYTGADFSHLEENADFAEGMYAFVTADVEHIEPELINSRKIKIKSVVSLDINVECSSPLSLPLELSGDNLQVKYGDFGGYTKALQKRDIITISDSLALPAGKPNIGALLKSDVSLCNKDVKVISGKVIVKGELTINNLYVPEGINAVDFCSHTLPFTEILDAEGLTEEHICRVRTDISESDFSLATDPDGDIRIINTSIQVGVRISADAPVAERVVTDAYSLTDNLNIICNTLDLLKPVAATDFDYTLKCSVRPGNVTSVYNISAKPVVTSSEAQNGIICTQGYVDLTALCLVSDETSPLMTFAEEIPFKIEASAEMCLPGMNVLVEIEPNLITHNLNVSGEVDLRIVLSCHTLVSENCKIDIADKVESAGPVDSRSPSIVLYFVQKNDTIWDIAKRYHTKAEYIEELNGEGCTPPVCGSQLLIPRG